MSSHPITPKCALMFHASDEKPLTQISLLKEDNRLSFLPSEWEELYGSLPHLLDDASAYIGDGAWRTDDEADDNYDFVWPDDGWNDESVFVNIVSNSRYVPLTFFFVYSQKGSLISLALC